MNMNYRSEFSDAGTTSYYGYDLNDPLPRTEINRRTWEYSPSMHIQDPTMLMHSQQNVVTTSDAAEECEFASFTFFSFLFSLQVAFFFRGYVFPKLLCLDPY